MEAEAEAPPGPSPHEEGEEEDGGVIGEGGKEVKEEEEEDDEEEEEGEEESADVERLGLFVQRLEHEVDLAKQECESQILGGTAVAGIAGASSGDSNDLMDEISNDSRLLSTSLSSAQKEFASLLLAQGEPRNDEAGAEQEPEVDIPDPMAPSPVPADAGAHAAGADTDDTAAQAALSGRDRQQQPFHAYDDVLAQAGGRAEAARRAARLEEKKRKILEHQRQLRAIAASRSPEEMNDVIKGDFQLIQDPQLLAEPRMSAEYAGLLGLDAVGITGYDSVVCLHLQEVVLRPDVEVLRIKRAVMGVAQLVDLEVLHQGSSQITARNVSMNPRGRGPVWEVLDVQVCISRRLRQRVLVCRFFAPYFAVLSDADVHQLSQKTKNLLELLRERLRVQHLTISCLSSLDPSTCALTLDQHFVVQLESLCREEMQHNLDKQSKALEAHVGKLEENNKLVRASMEHVYSHFALRLPPLPEIPPVNTTSLVWEEVEEAEEAAASAAAAAAARVVADANAHAAATEAAAVAAGRPTAAPAVRTAASPPPDALATILIMVEDLWHRLQSTCDRELMLRVRQKNDQVVERVENASQFERDVFELVAFAPSVSRHSTTTTFHDAFAELAETRLVRGEVPLYWCMSIVGQPSHFSRRPCMLYITQQHICLAARMLLTTWRCTIPLDNIRNVSVQPATSYPPMPAALRLMYNSTVGDVFEARTPGAAMENRGRGQGPATTMEFHCQELIISFPAVAPDSVLLVLQVIRKLKLPLISAAYASPGVDSGPGGHDRGEAQGGGGGPGLGRGAARREGGGNSAGVYGSGGSGAVDDMLGGGEGGAETEDAAPRQDDEDFLDGNSGYARPSPLQRGTAEEEANAATWHKVRLSPPSLASLRRSGRGVRAGSGDSGGRAESAAHGAAAEHDADNQGEDAYGNGGYAGTSFDSASAATVMASPIHKPTSGPGTGPNPPTGGSVILSFLGGRPAGDDLRSGSGGGVHRQDQDGEDDGVDSEDEEGDDQESAPGVVRTIAV